MDGSVDLVDQSGMVRGRIELQAVSQPRHGVPVLIDLSTDPGRSAVEAPLQLLEDGEYHYAIELDNADDVVVDVRPASVVSPSPDGWHGRLRPGRFIGSLRIEVDTSHGGRTSCEVEVRSRKLRYRDEYRRMLTEIARLTTELLQSAASPTQLRSLRPEVGAMSKTTYQRFVFLQAVVDSDQMRAAIGRIRTAPHHVYRARQRPVDPGAGLAPSAQTVKQLVSPGARQRIDRPLGGLDSLPRAVVLDTKEPNFDTTPNRFVRWAIERWLHLVHEVERALSCSSDAERQHREATELRETLERVLELPAIRAAGHLHQFPADDQVLQSRPGYREILDAFVLAESGGRIDWDAGDHIFGAGQRDVAVLYEYWTFLELVELVRTLPGFEADVSNLVQLDGDRFALSLRRSTEVQVTAQGLVRGRPVTIELWFNKAFRRAGAEHERSWSLQLRPDCSLRVRTAERESWIHFDAKYRVDLTRQSLESSEMFDPDDEIVDDAAASALRSAPASGVAKMHAYHDAIVRSVGAFVLFPGDEKATADRGVVFEQFIEVLPGIGSFVMNPGTWANGGAKRELRRFLADVIDHLAAEGTEHSRAEYWSDVVRRSGRPLRLDPVAIGKSIPPADVNVLVGRVRNPENLQWIMTTGWYNLRADPDRRGAVLPSSRELHTDLVLLHWGDDDDQRTVLLPRRQSIAVRTAADLVGEGYLEPGGATYLCVEVDPAPVATADGRPWRVPRPRSDAPFVCDLATLMSLASNPHTGRTGRLPVEP